MNGKTNGKHSRSKLISAHDFKKFPRFRPYVHGTIVFSKVNVKHSLNM